MKPVKKAILEDVKKILSQITVDDYKNYILPRQERAKRTLERIKDEYERESFTQYNTECSQSCELFLMISLRNQYNAFAYYALDNRDARKLVLKKVASLGYATPEAEPKKEVMEKVVTIIPDRFTYSNTNVSNQFNNIIDSLSEMDNNGQISFKPIMYPVRTSPNKKNVPEVFARVALNYSGNNPNAKIDNFAVLVLEKVISFVVGADDYSNISKYLNYEYFITHGNRKMTLEQLWKHITGDDNARLKKNSKQEKQLLEVLETLQDHSVYIYVKEELDAKGYIRYSQYIDDGDIPIGGRLLHFDYCALPENGTLKQAIEVKGLSPFFEYAILKNQVLYLDNHKYFVSENKSYTKKSLTIRHYLAKEIEGARHGRRSEVFLLDTIRSKCGFIFKHRADKQRLIEDVSSILEEYKNNHIVSGYRYDKSTERFVIKAKESAD